MKVIAGRSAASGRRLRVGALLRARRSSVVVVCAALTVALLAGVAGAAAGDLDPSFGSGGKVLTDFGNDLAYAVALQPDGKIVAAGGSNFALARYNVDGSLDASFGTGGKVLTDVGGSALAVALQPDGKIVAAGFSHYFGYNSDFALVRYNAGGSLDASFGSGGKVLTDFGSSYDLAHAVALQPDGKVVAAGASDIGGSVDFALVRYNADGSLDASFGSGGKVVTDFPAAEEFDRDEAHGVVLQPDGKIVAAGTSHFDIQFADFALARYNTDGSLDASFGTGGRVETDSYRAEFASAAALQPDGKIVAAGFSHYFGYNSDFALARYNTDGSLDASFGWGGKVETDLGGWESDHDEAHGLVLQPDGKVVAAGFSNLFDYPSDFALVRYSADGSLDASFGSGGKVLTDFSGGSFSSDLAYAVARQPDGKIVAAGRSNASGSYDFALARYLGDEVAPPQVADLTVNKRDRPDPVAVGETLTYLIFVANNGPQEAVGVTLEDVLPASVAFLSARTRRGNCTESSGVVRCELGTFPAGDRATVQIDVRPTRARRIRNAVTVYSGTYDPDTSNNTARVRTTVVER